MFGKYSNKNTLLWIKHLANPLCMITAFNIGCRETLVMLNSLAMIEIQNLKGTCFQTCFQCFYSSSSNILLCFLSNFNDTESLWTRLFTIILTSQYDNSQFLHLLLTPKILSLFLSENVFPCMFWM